MINLHAHRKRTRAFVLVAYALFVVAMLALWGCSNTRTVRVPAKPSTINVEVPEDTTRLEEVPPLRVRGSLTMPERVVVYRDTVWPTVDLSWLEIDRRDMDDQTVRVRTQQDSQTVERTYQLPAPGEGLRLLPGEGTPLEGTVFGAPTEYEVEADVTSIERPWYRKTWDLLRLLLAFFGGAVFAYVAVKILPGV